jgi:hypothetical protein
VRRSCRCAIRSRCWNNNWGTIRSRFSPADRAFLAALLHQIPRDKLCRFRLLVRPGTVLRWRKDLLARHHAARFRPSAVAGRAPSALSASWYCAWHGRTRPEATGASTANSSSSASRPPPRPCGRSFTAPGSTPRPSTPPPPELTSFAPRPTLCWPATSSKPPPWTAPVCTF